MEMKLKSHRVTSVNKGCFFIDITGPQITYQTVVPTENIERQKAVMPIIPVKKTPYRFLMKYPD